MSQSMFDTKKKKPNINQEVNQNISALFDNSEELVKYTQELDRRIVVLHNRMALIETQSSALILLYPEVAEKIQNLINETIKEMQEKIDASNNLENIENQNADKTE